MKAQYIRAMDAMHHACMFVAGTCLVIITLIIPYGVFTRYVLNSASSWPEPMAVLLMIVLSFLVGRRLLPRVPAYRRRRAARIADRRRPAAALGWLLEICMLGTNLFMLWWGIKLVQTTWYQSDRRVPDRFGRHRPICRSRSAARSPPCSSSSACGRRNSSRSPTPRPSASSATE